MSRWWQRYEGPALLVALITAIFMGGASWWEMKSVTAQARETTTTVQINGNRITALEEQSKAIADSLNDIRQSLRDINNDLKTRR